MNREYHKWHSPRVGREMELLAFGHAGARVLVFPARMGRFYDYENWGMVARLRSSIEAGLIQLFCVDSLDAEALYNPRRPPPERLRRHEDYERYILDEVVPFTRHSNFDPTLIAHGCSLGAYHAVNLAFRHPGLIQKVVALSGRYDLTLPCGHYHDLLDGHYDESVYFHTPSHFVPNLPESHELQTLRQMRILLACGRDDPILPNNLRFSQALWDKGIRHDLHHWEGEAHRPSAWRQMITCYL